ncbi:MULTISPECIES: prevent-host-death protein [Vibrio]|uniref:Type II toxin-antitoxin system Phd/YefM family antitoxin n=1 Tax=Vibrio pectenicida TaxID=62763 RepID=A0A427U174_9VIBR|nr:MULTISPECIES: prevent-host-death protein [Vibrio]RSD30391.1 type II toxin-antitoxin system Phd/YefM family antitoxin [Vibrio pectenicida]
MDTTNVETVSFLKKNAANLPVEEPLTITQNGKPAYVVESYEDHKNRQDAIALLKLISFAKNDILQGQVMSSGDLRRRLSERK